MTQSAPTLPSRNPSHRTRIDDYLQGIDLSCADCNADLSDGGANIDAREAAARMQKHLRESPKCHTFNRIEYRVIVFPTTGGEGA